MNDTHGADIDEGDPIAELAALDPAEAPEVAEGYAAELAAELEEAGAQPARPLQLRADLGDTADAPSADS